MLGKTIAKNIDWFLEYECKIRVEKKCFMFFYLWCIDRMCTVESTSRNLNGKQHVNGIKKKKKKLR